MSGTAGGRSLITPLVLVLLVAHGAEAARPKGAASVNSAPALADTPTAKLGTAPRGFGLKVGDKAPDATLPDVSGSTHSLAELYAQSPTLVIFYRGEWKNDNGKF